MIVIASLLIIAFGVVVLTITASSRRITSHYENYYGLYDLAVAGNEQAFFIIERAFSQNRDLSDVHAELNKYFNFINFEYHKTWQLSLDFSNLPEGGTVTDRYTAVTIIKEWDGGFYIDTEIFKYADSEQGVSAIVRSAVNILDCNTVKMVELHRVAD